MSSTPSRKRTLQQRLDDGSVLDPKSGCRLWKKPGSTGYGNISVAGRTMRAHRAAWIAKYDVIPRGLVVCHRCDTPLCINTDHLFLGTQKDNMADRANKLRVRKRSGVQKPRSGSPGVVRLEIMGREIVMHVLAVRPLAHEGPPPTTLPKPGGGERS